MDAHAPIRLRARGKSRELTLAGELDVGQAEALLAAARRALAAGEGAVKVDAGGVESVHSAALQILAVLALELGRQGRPFRLVASSEAFSRSLALCGLEPLLQKGPPP